MIRFSNELNLIYEDNTDENYDNSKVSKKFYNGPQNLDEAKKYVLEIFPQHLAKARQIFKHLITFPKGCGYIKVLDIGCGPLTFTQAVLEELNWRSGLYNGGIYEIRIKGIDLSEFQLLYGMKMIQAWDKIIQEKGWHLFKSMLKTNADFNSTKSEIQNWLEESRDEYLLIGISASISSGVNNIRKLLQTLIPIIKDRKFSIIIIEPYHFEEKEEMQKIFDFLEKKEFLNVRYETLKFSLLKPEKMERLKKKRVINAPFKAIIIENTNKFLYFLLDSAKIFNSNEKFIIPFNKAIRWLNYQNLTDQTEILLYNYDVDHSFELLKRELLLPFRYNYKEYDSRKGFDFLSKREFTLIPMVIAIKCSFILNTVGKLLDTQLTNEVYGSRIYQNLSLNKIYRHYPKYYRVFKKLGIYYFKAKLNNLSLFETDIEEFYGSITIAMLEENLRKNLDSLSSELVNFLRKFKNQKYGIELITDTFLNLLGKNREKGIPIGLPLSPLLANIFLSEKDRDLKKLPFVKQYGRYMDDIKLVVSCNKTEINKEKICNEVNSLLNDLRLSLKKKKTKLSDIGDFIGSSKLLQLNSELKDLDEKIREIFHPIYLIGYSLLNTKKFGKNLNKIIPNSEEFLKLFVCALHRIGLFIEFDYLRKIIITKFYHNNSVNNSKYDLIVLPKDFNQINDVEELVEKIQDLNKDWYEKYIDLQNILYTRLFDEMDNWNDFLDVLGYIINCTDEDMSSDLYLEKKKKILEILKLENYILSYRKINYLAYRLSSIGSLLLYKKDDKILNKLIKLDLVGFSPKLIAKLCYRYNHIELLEKKLDESWSRQKNRLTSDEEVCPRFFSNEMGYFLHYLGLYYKDNIELFDISKWYDKLKNFLEGGQYEERLAVTEFILQLNIVNHWDYDYWIDRLINEDDFNTAKNLFLCLAFHEISTIEIPLNLKQLMLKKARKHEYIINKILYIWKKLKENTSEKLFDPNEILTCIDLKKKRKITDEFEFISDLQIEEDFDILVNDLPEDDEGIIHDPS
jgi:hypothetical protein